MPLNEALGDRDKTMNTIEPYLKRPVKFLKQVNSGNWRIKVYGISAKSESLPEELVNEGVNTVLPHLPEPPVSGDRYGVGFLIIHQGTLRNWFLLDWWEYEDILGDSGELSDTPIKKPNNYQSIHLDFGFIYAGNSHFYISFI